MRDHVGRRRFIKTAALGLGMAATLGAEESLMSASNQAAASSAVKYWMHGFGGDAPADTAKALRDAGFSVVVAGGSAVIEAVNGAGMEAWLCGGGFPLVRDEDGLKSVDVAGSPQVWFGSGSPAHPEVRAASLAHYEELVKTTGIAGVLVDGVRFASPASGLMPFLTDFSEHAAARARELGFDFDLMKGDVARLHSQLTNREAPGQRAAAWLASPVGVVEWLSSHPGVLEWLRFRRAHVTAHFREIARIIHGAGLRMGVYIFTPSLAPLVGQSYEDLRELADVFAPMIYRNYPDHPGPACLNWELAELPRELGLPGTAAEQETLRMVLSWVGLSHLKGLRSFEDVKTALPPEAVGSETRRARELIGADKELAPIIYIDDPEMAVTAQQVRAGGATGINFFVYKDAWESMTRPAMG